MSKRKDAKAGIAKIVRVCCIAKMSAIKSDERFEKKKKIVIAHEGWRRAKSSIQTRDVSPSVWIDKIRKTR